MDGTQTTKPEEEMKKKRKNKETLRRARVVHNISFKQNVKHIMMDECEVSNACKIKKNVIELLSKLQRDFVQTILNEAVFSMKERQNVKLLVRHCKNAAFLILPPSVSSKIVNQAVANTEKTINSLKNQNKNNMNGTAKEISKTAKNAKELQFSKFSLIVKHSIPACNQKAASVPVFIKHLSDLFIKEVIEDLLKDHDKSSIVTLGDFEEYTRSPDCNLKEYFKNKRVVEVQCLI